MAGPGLTKMGFESLLYYGTAGSTAATLITNCRDVNHKKEPEFGDTSIKGAGTSPVTISQRVTAMKHTLTWQMTNKPADTTLAALIAAQATGGGVALKYLTHSGGTGVDADFVLSIENGAPYKGEQTFDFTAVVTEDYDRGVTNI